MRTGISITVASDDLRRLEGIVGDRNRAQKYIARAKVILATAAGFGTNEIVRRSGLSKPNVWRWQERFMHEGVDGLLRDKTRPPGKLPVSTDTVQRVLALTVAEPPGETTHWTVRMMAGAVGISAATVHRIWKAHGLAPHRTRTFKLSNDINFASKLRDVVGLYIDPPAHAIVLSVDEKSQIQALEAPHPKLLSLDTDAPAQPPFALPTFHELGLSGLSWVLAWLDAAFACALDDFAEQRGGQAGAPWVDDLNYLKHAFSRGRAVSRSEEERCFADLIDVPMWQVGLLRTFALDPVELKLICLAAWSWTGPSDLPVRRGGQPLDACPVSFQERAAARYSSRLSGVRAN